MIYKGIDKWNNLFLQHYGVKGMKWGVRKSDYSLERSTAGKGTVRNLRKGSTVYRISSGEKGIKSSVAYGSVNKKDDDAWARHLTSKSYRQEYKVNSDIKVASERVLNKAYVDTLLKTKAGRKSVREALLYRDYDTYDTELSKEANQYFEKNPDSSFYEYFDVNGKHVGSHDKNDNWWSLFENPKAIYHIVALDKPLTDARAAASLYRNNPNSKAAKTLTKVLKKKGYTAISDIRGYDVADNPIIFLDKSQLTQTSSKRIVNENDKYKDKYKGLDIIQRNPLSSYRKKRDEMIKNRQYHTDYKYY